MYSDNKQIRDVADVAARIMAGLPPIAEELKGGQVKLDKNHNNKIDAKDFKILKGEKKMKEETELDDDEITEEEYLALSESDRKLYELSTGTLNNYIGAARKDIRAKNAVNKFSGHGGSLGRAFKTADARMKIRKRGDVDLHQGMNNSKNESEELEEGKDVYQVSHKGSPEGETLFPKGKQVFNHTTYYPDSAQRRHKLLSKLGYHDVQTHKNGVPIKEELEEDQQDLAEVKMADLPSTKVQGRAYGAYKPEPDALDLVKGPKEKDLKSIEAEKKKKMSEMIAIYKNDGMKAFFESIEKEYLIYEEPDGEIKTTHKNPLVTVHDKHGLHTHANLSVANDIHGTNVSYHSIHSGSPVKVGDKTFGLSKHHASEVKEEVESIDELNNEDYSHKEIKMAHGIAKDKRYAGGNMTGAVKAIDKIKSGLSQHPAVQKALKRANEEVEQIDETDNKFDNYMAHGDAERNKAAQARENKKTYKNSNEGKYVQHGAKVPRGYEMTAHGRVVKAHKFTYESEEFDFDKEVKESIEILEELSVRHKQAQARVFDLLAHAKAQRHNNKKEVIVKSMKAVDANKSPSEPKMTKFTTTTLDQDVRSALKRPSGPKMTKFATTTLDQDVRAARAKKI